MKQFNSTRIYPTGENVYGMFSNKCIAFDSATFFGEQTTCDRDSKWFYNKETGFYDIFLEKGEIFDLYFIYAKSYKEGYKKFNTLVGAEPMLTKKGYGFVSVEGMPDFFIPAFAINGDFDGDDCIVEIFNQKNFR